jgi:hypothetical protein
MKNEESKEKSSIIPSHSLPIPPIK